MAPVSAPGSASAENGIALIVRLKVKVKVHTLDIAPLRIVNHHRRSAQVWHVFSRDFTVLPAHPHVHPQSE